MAKEKEGQQTPTTLMENMTDKITAMSITIEELTKDITSVKNMLHCLTKEIKTEHSSTLADVQLSPGTMLTNTNLPGSYIIITIRNPLYYDSVIFALISLLNGQICIRSNLYTASIADKPTISLKELLFINENYDNWNILE